MAQFAYRYTVCIYSTPSGYACPMKRESAVAVIPGVYGVEPWRIMLRDEGALLAMPGAHHKALLTQAYALHQGHVIDADELGDLLELADAALAYAVESLLDLEADE